MRERIVMRTNRILNKQELEILHDGVGAGMIIGAGCLIIGMTIRMIVDEWRKSSKT
jgi:formate/nitrite transporter FocA (FNT family)